MRGSPKSKNCITCSQVCASPSKLRLLRRPKAEVRAWCLLLLLLEGNEEDEEDEEDEEAAAAAAAAVAEAAAVAGPKLPCART